MTTAAIITYSSSTMPTAVITESSENTASSTTICATIGQNARVRRAAPRARARRASTRSWISIVALISRNSAAGDQDQVAPRDLAAARA